MDQVGVEAMVLRNPGDGRLGLLTGSHNLGFELGRIAATLLWGFRYAE
jgi:hypothetical protein